MTKLLECDVAVMGSGVAGMGAAYKLANAGGLKIAVFEKYPAQGGAVSNCPMSFCSTRTPRKHRRMPMKFLPVFPITVQIWGLSAKC